MSEASFSTGIMGRSELMRPTCHIRCNGKSVLMCLVLATVLFIILSMGTLSSKYTSMLLHSVRPPLLQSGRAAHRTSFRDKHQDAYNLSTMLNVSSYYVDRLLRLGEDNIINKKEKGNNEAEFVVFLKVHKAASTTVQNILLRRAIFQNLSVVLHRTRPHLNEHGTTLPWGNLTEIPPGARYNILCHHIMFDKREISKLFPDSTLYIGIVRDPFERFVSSFFYYAEVWKDWALLRCIEDHPHNPILAYLRNPAHCERTSRINTSPTFQRLSRDFGFSLEDLAPAYDNVSIIHKFIEDIDNAFDFIMLAEYFDESVIMLRRLLNWPFRDMIYVKLNSISNRDSHVNIYKRALVRKKYRAMYKRWAPTEYALYSHFKLKFLKHLRSQGQDFHEELNIFVSIRKKVEQYCQVSIAEDDGYSPLLIGRNKWTQSFTITKVDCLLLTMNEDVLTNLVRYYQNKRAEEAIKLGRGRG